MKTTRDTPTCYVCGDLRPTPPTWRERGNSSGQWRIFVNMVDKRTGHSVTTCTKKACAQQRVDVLVDRMKADTNVIQRPSATADWNVAQQKWW